MEGLLFAAMLYLAPGEVVERYVVDDQGECIAIIRKDEERRAAPIPCEVIAQEQS